MLVLSMVGVRWGVVDRVRGGTDFETYINKGFTFTR